MTTVSENLQRARPGAEELPPVLVWHARAEEYARLLRDHLPGVRIEATDERRAEEVAVDFPVVLTWRPPAGAFDCMPSLRWLHAAGAGVDHLLERDDLAPGVTVTRSHGRFGEQAAEFVVGYLLALLIGVEQYRRDQDRAVWRPRPRRLLADLTVGVIGLGKLGTVIAERLDSMGVEVLAACRNARPADVVRRVYSQADWRSMLRHCDALVLAAPLTPETRGMIDREALEVLPEGALLVNVARGELLQDEALLEALRHGRVSAAVLDAFATEPLPADSPLWTEPSAWITPHVAAPSEVEPIVREFVSNYRRFTEGLEMSSVVDRDRGY